MARLCQTRPAFRIFLVSAVFVVIFLQNRAVFCAAETGGAWAGTLDSAAAAFHKGLYREALDYYRRAWPEVERARAPAEVKGRVLRGIGACWLMLSDYRAALEYFSQARPYVIRGGNREELAILESNIGSTYLQQGDLEKARRGYRRALEALASRPESPHRSSILANLALVQLRQQRFREAIDVLQSALRQTRSADSSSAAAAMTDLLGYARLGLADYKGAKEAFARGVELRRASGGSPSASLTFLGLAELRSGSPQAAVETLNESIEQARQRGAQTDLWRALYFRGRSHWALNEREQAVADLWRSVEVLESIQPKLFPSDPLRVLFEATHHDVYNALADALCDLRNSEDAFRAVELGRAQSLRTLLEQRRDPPAGATLPRVIGLREAQHEIVDRDSLLLNFYVSWAGAYVWAVTGSEAHLYRLPPPSEWQPDIRRFLKGIEANNAEWRAAGERLYRALLGPVDARLLERRHWIIAADAGLVVVPFCALPAGARGKGKRFLIEEHSFSYAPSVSVLASLERSGAPEFDYDFLGVADPVVNRADARWPAPPVWLEAAPRLARLVSSEAEIRSCARLFTGGRSSLLTGFEASLPRLQEAASHSYRYWHLSSHVVADTERAERSFIALSAPPQGGTIQRLTMADVLDLPARAEMVLLSGCDSGTGKNLPGAGVVGLARAFLAAGASSVCATRWKIPDDGGALVTSLYRRLTSAGARADRAEALRAAQVEMIRAGDWRSEPRYWAAYFLIGSHRSPPRESSTE